MDADSENYDVDVVNANSLLVDANVGVVICTSVTRPSTPYSGQSIYETDTGKFGLWRSDLAQWIVPRATPYASTVAPTLGLYEGFLYYRTDRDWYEVWDGAFWRVVGVGIVANFGELATYIPNPRSGQVAITTDFDVMWQYDGATSTWIALGPRLMKRHRRSTTSANSTNNTAVAVARLDGVLGRAGRALTVRTGALHPTSTVTTDTMRLEIRFSTSGVATTASAVLPGAQIYENWGNTGYIEGTVVPGADSTYSFLLCHAREIGSGTATVYADGTRLTEIKVYDEGLDPGSSGTNL